MQFDRSNIPTVAEYVAKLAEEHGVQYQQTDDDKLAIEAAKLAGDDVETDPTEDLLVQLVRDDVITDEQMVDLLAMHLEDTHSSKDPSP